MSTNLILRSGASCELNPCPTTDMKGRRDVSYLPSVCLRTRLLGDLMAISKRLRFEILRRDQHCCRYCGEHASPQVKITVDHVLPVALGGTDAATNLVAACGPCNAGKSATNPDAPLVAQVSDDEIRWRRAMASAAEKQSRMVSAKYRYLTEVREIWESTGWGQGLAHLPDDHTQSVFYWFSIGVPINVVQDSYVIAMIKKDLPDRAVWPYMVGIVRNRIEEMERDASSAMTGAR